MDRFFPPSTSVPIEAGFLKFFAPGIQWPQSVRARAGRGASVARCVSALVFSLGVATAVAQPAPRADNALVQLTASAELELPNDEAVASFAVEVQDADAQRAQTLVNQRAAVGLAALKKADPSAQIETAGYSSYPVYARDGNSRITGWRVRQGLQLRTTDLAALPRTIAQGQETMILAGVEFRVSRKAREGARAELIRRAVGDLNLRVAAVAQALNVAPERLRLEELSFSPEGGERPPMMFRAQSAADAPAAPPPALEAGSSLQQLTVSAKLRITAP
jgi:predicted secreted protein